MGREGQEGARREGGIGREERGAGREGGIGREGGGAAGGG